MKTIQIRAVLFQDNAFWCAQCLECDIAVQALSRDSLVQELGSALAAYVELARLEHRRPFSDMRPAPQRFFEMFEQAHELPSSSPKIEVSDAPGLFPEIRVLEAA